jgi:arabinofuranan 3-O-arabinosyltransferase
VSRDLSPVRPAAPAPVAARPVWRRRDLAEPAAYGVLGLCVLAVLVLTDRGWFAPDTRPELYLAPWRALTRSLAAWRPDPYLGQPNFDAGTAPAAAVLAVIRGLGVDAWLAVRLWRALLLGVAGWGAARLLRTVAPEAGAAGRVAAATVYVANPYVVVAGATSPVLQPYALLPWLLVALAWSVRDRRSWRGPAAFALAFFGCGGTNAGVVPVFMLLAVPCYLLYARLAGGVPWRAMVAPVLRCLGLALAVSLYWLVPAVLASGSGQAIAESTEKPGDVAAASSYAEALRLLGLWTLYGREGERLFLPGLAGYLADPLVVLASFAPPVAAAAGALVSRARARALGVLLLAVAVPVMVGLFPTTAPTPFARLLEAAFGRLPGAIAFRTTNKAGALAALGITVLVAAGVAELWRRRNGPARAASLVGALAVLAVAVLPAWTGGLHLERYRVPGYWEQAAADLNRGAGPAAGRVLFLPGQVQADYRWGWQGPDDLNASLLARPSVVRATVPNGSPEQANFLAALDVPLAGDQPDARALPAMARYLGVDEVLARNDVVGETTGGGPPAALAAALAAQPGLRLAGSYGRPGEQVAARPGDPALPPLQRYALADPRPVVRAEPAAGALLVDGDSFALPALARLGLLAGQPAFRLLGSLTPGDTALALDDGARVVLTDSNRRRTWATRRTGASYSPTLPADRPIDPSSPALSLFGGPSAQTVATLSGAASVEATSSGSVFGPVPYGKPAFAFDGDPRTAWVTGDFGAGVGQSVTLRLVRPLTVSKLVLRPLLGGPVQVAAVRIHLDGRTVPAAVPARPGVEVALPPTTTGSVTVEITGVRGGPGLNPVGFWEIEVPGVRVAETAVLPRRLRQLGEGLDAAGRERLAAAPLDVVLARAAGPTRGLDDDEERVLDRRFWLPGARAFDLSGLAAPGPDLAEPELDRLLGASPEVTARSSSRAFDGVGVRASQAFDGNRDTAWIPAGRGPGEWLEASFPARRLDHVVVRQDVPRGLKGVDAATAAELSLDGGPPVRARLRQGATRIGFPARTVRRLRLTITDVVGLGGQVRISELQAGRARVDAGNRPGTRLHGCVTMAEVDGVPVRARLRGTLDQLAKGEPLRFEGCGGARRLGPGDHHLRGAPGWLVDLLRLASPGRRGPGDRGGDPPDGREPAATEPSGATDVAAAPRVTVTSSGAARTELAVEPAAAPYYLVAGQGYDRRWRATMDGQPLGPPELLDGWSIGWRISDLGPHRFAVEFGPQRQATASLLATLAALAVVAALLARGRWWR